MSFRFVSSGSIPDWMAEKVAYQAHKRGCGAFDGSNDRAVSPPKFDGQHRREDVVWASVHIADLCNALQVTPQQIADERKAGPSGGDE